MRPQQRGGWGTWQQPSTATCPIGNCCSRHWEISRTTAALQPKHVAHKSSMCRHDTRWRQARCNLSVCAAAVDDVCLLGAAAVGCCQVCLHHGLQRMRTATARCMGQARVSTQTQYGSCAVSTEAIVAGCCQPGRDPDDRTSTAVPRCCFPHQHAPVVVWGDRGARLQPATPGQPHAAFGEMGLPADQYMLAVVRMPAH